MGVKGFSRLIEKFPKCRRERKFHDYRGCCIAIDAPLTIYRFCIAILNTDHFKSDEVIKGHIFAGFYKTCSMLRYAIKPIWVFDGKPPDIKNDTLHNRKKRKDSASERLSSSPELEEKEINKLEKRAFSITNELMDDLKYLLDLMGIPYTKSPGEAEAQCSALNIADIADGVATEDWDVILFGCKKMLKDFSNKNMVLEIDTQQLLDDLGMNRDQLIDLSSILGNDYCHGISGLKPLNAYEKFKEANFNIDTFLDNLKNEKKNNYIIPNDFKEKLEAAKEYYINASVNNPSNIEVTWKKPNYKELYKYLVCVKGLNQNNIRDKILELELMYTYYVLNDNNLMTLSHIKRINKEYPSNIYDRKKQISTRPVRFILKPNYSISAHVS